MTLNRHIYDTIDNTLVRKMAISDSDVVDFIKNKNIKMVDDRLIIVPKKKEKGFFHVEMDVPEEEIDELLSDETSKWIE